MAFLPFEFDAESVPRLNGYADLPALPAIQQLQSRRQWVCWKYVERDGGGKPTKPPYQPATGFKASHSEPRHWGSYSDAVNRANRSRMEGVGYVLTDDDGISGFDLDNCRDPETGELDAWAQAIVDLGETYCEVSPSETGLRFIMAGKIDKALKSDAAGVEMYASKRYLTITGWHVPGTPTDIRPAPATIKALTARVEAIKPVVPEHAPSMPGIATHALPAPSGNGDPFRAVNTAALANLDLWVPAIWGSAARPTPSGTYRISSQYLGRNLQEDLSISPLGIKDFGVHDLGDARHGGRTPIDLVIEFGKEGSAINAAMWLCTKLGRDPAHFGFDDRKAHNGAEIADALLAGRAQKVGADWIDPETGEVLPPSPFLIDPEPFYWSDPSKLPMRQWVYGGHYIRKFLSLTLAPGGVGKSSLTMVEALAMATGEPLLGVQPQGTFNVWLWNGEDPMDEMQRRMTAAVKHFGLNPHGLEHCLFMNSGRNTEIIVAQELKGETKIAIPIVEAVKAAIKRRSIDVLIVDPFVSSHRVSENDNGAIDQVAKLWAKIADETNCSIELVHHVRKTQAGGEITVEDGRGASSLLAAARSARVLNPMSEEEQKRCGVPNKRGFFRMDNGKSNMAPPPDHSFWHQIVGVPLMNGPLGTDGDSIAVVAPWRWPDPTADTTSDDLARVQEAIRTAMNCREDARSKDWAGNVIADVLELDASDEGSRAMIKGLIAAWVKKGALKIVERPDAKRMMRRFVEVDNAVA